LSAAGQILPGRDDGYRKGHFGDGLQLAEALRVTEPTLEDTASRLAVLLSDPIREPFRLLTSQAVARMLGVSEDWVREHAAELGAIRIGDGPRGALRFDTARLRAALDRRRVGRPAEHTWRRAAPRRRSLGIVPAAVPSDVKDW
jgi:hypothetical protein